MVERKSEKQERERERGAHHNEMDPIPYVERKSELCVAQ
jgi:hypothetical protein